VLVAVLAFLSLSTAQVSSVCEESHAGAHASSWGD
jgi:hypothetical protein